MAPHDQHSDHFEPQDTIKNTINTTLQLTVAGAVFAGVQNTLRKQNVGAMGIVTRSGGIIAVFAGAGIAFQFTKDAAANLRRKNDTYNDALAGFMGGSVIGIAKRSIPIMITAGVGYSTALAAFRYTNGMGGYARTEGDEDEVDRKERERKMRRRPLHETIEQLGEGRGIYASGYEERRRERILAKYGIDVKAAQ